MEFLRGLANIVLMTVFLVVGQAVNDRSLTGHERTANLAFTYWWMATAALMAVRATRNLAVAFWQPELAMFVVETQLSIIIACLGLATLTFYFAYLFTGEHRVWIPIAAFYSVYVVFLLYMIAHQRPIGLEESGWRMFLIFESPNATLGGPRSAVLLFIPPIIGCVGYLSLYRTVPTRMQRFRIACVATGLLLWLSTYFLVYIFQVDVSLNWSIGERLIGLLAAIVILLGYKAPKNWRQRLEATP